MTLVRSRSLRLDDALPSIRIEEFREERPRHRRPTPSPTAVLTRVNPPGYEQLLELQRAAASVRVHYERTIAVHRGFPPRLQSRVDHRIECSAQQAWTELCRGDGVRVELGALRLVTDPTRIMYDSFEHEHCVHGRFHLPWSWPSLPVWVRVGEFSATHCRVGLSLRSRKRLRYPLRYFHAAHTVLTELETRVRAA